MGWGPHNAPGRRAGIFACQFTSVHHYISQNSEILLRSMFFSPIRPFEVLSYVSVNSLVFLAWIVTPRKELTEKGILLQYVRIAILMLEYLYSTVLVSFRGGS